MATETKLRSTTSFITRLSCARSVTVYVTKLSGPQSCSASGTMCSSPMRRTLSARPPRPTIKLLVLTSMQWTKPFARQRSAAKIPPIQAHHRSATKIPPFQAHHIRLNASCRLLLPLPITLHLPCALAERMVEGVPSGDALDGPGYAKASVELELRRIKMCLKKYILALHKFVRSSAHLSPCPQ